jgi:hypothetical protein
MPDQLSGRVIDQNHRLFYIRDYHVVKHLHQVSFAKARASSLSGRIYSCKKLRHCRIYPIGSCALSAALSFSSSGRQPCPACAGLCHYDILFVKAVIKQGSLYLAQRVQRQKQNLRSSSSLGVGGKNILSMNFLETDHRGSPTCMNGDSWKEGRPEILSR